MDWKNSTLLCSIALATIAAAQDTRPTFKSKAELVLVPTVVSKGGQPVTGLSKDDFILLHDGKAEQVASFEEVDAVPASVEPVSLPPHTVQNYAEADSHQDIVILLLDFLNGGWSTANRMRSYLKDMTDQLAQTRTPVTVLLLTNKGLIQVHSFTSAPENLTKTVALWTSGLPVVNDQNSGITTGADIGGSAWSSAITSTNVVGGTRALAQFARLPGNSQRQLDRASMTLQAVEEISQAFRGIPGRKKMIWMSTGFPRVELVEQKDSGPPDTASLARQRISDAQSSDVLSEFKLSDRRRRSWAALSDANIAVYPLDSNGGGNPAPSYFNPESPTDAFEKQIKESAPAVSAPVTSDTLSMLEVAQKTGGQSCSDLPTACVKKAQADANHYYLLGFYLHGEKKAGWHKLSVKMSLPDVTARTRQGFMVGPPEVSSAGKNKNDGKKLATKDAKKEAGRSGENALLDEGTLISALASTLDYTSVSLRLSWSRSPSQNDSTATSKVELVVQSPPDGIAVDPDSQTLNVDYLAFVRPVGKTEGHYYPDTLVMKLSPAQQKGLGDDGFRYRHKLDLAPGRYEVRVLLRDNVSQKIGTVSTVVDLLNSPIAKQ